MLTYDEMIYQRPKCQTRRHRSLGFNADKPAAKSKKSIQINDPPVSFLLKKSTRVERLVDGFWAITQYVN